MTWPEAIAVCMVLVTNAAVLITAAVISCKRMDDDD